MLNFNKYKVLTFDCYGTLIDWEAGILSALKPILSNYSVTIDDSQILEIYAEFEAKAEQEPYETYRIILQSVLRGFGDQFDFTPSATELTQFSNSIQNWPPFADSTKALNALKTKYKIGILSNVDDDLFSYSAHNLNVDFDFVCTAQQIGSYKPDLRNFEFAINKMGIDREHILHVAQSLFHDILPAKKLGLDTVWVNRRKGKKGSGATPPAEATPDLEVPDLKSLATKALENS